MSWESTQTYYRLINQKVRDEPGGLHSARLVLYSVDFAEIEALQHQGDCPHIADATARVLRNDGIACVGLLGTRFTMPWVKLADRQELPGCWFRVR